VYAHRLVSAVHSIRSFDSGSFGASYTGTQVGTGYAAPDTGEYWCFAKWGNLLFAVQDNVDPQVLDWSSAGSFSALSGSPPRATGVYPIHDFVFLAGLATNRRKIRWSGINDHTFWTVGTNLCDEQEFPDGGDVCGIAGGMSGYVIQKQAIRAYQFLPGDTTRIFEFSKVEGAPGCVGLQAWAAANQSIYYISEEGFCSIGPQGFRRIGAHRVDREFLSSAVNLDRSIAVADPFRPHILFCLSFGGNPLIYDYHLDRWSRRPANWHVPVVHLEGTGGAAQMAVVNNSNGDLVHLNGSNMQATLVTPPIEIFQTGANAGKRADIKRIRPLVDGSAGSIASVNADHMETLQDNFATAQSFNQEANGWFTFGTTQTSGAYHQFRLGTAGVNNTTFLKGLQVEAQPAGEV
jgi:hypothetical protein